MSKEDFKETPEAEKSDHERFWDQTFNTWSNFGCIEDKDHPKPKEHPRKDHLWNIDPQAYLELKGIKYNILDPDADQDLEEY